MGGEEKKRVCEKRGVNSNRGRYVTRREEMWRGGRSMCEVRCVDSKREERWKEGWRGGEER